MQKSDHLEAAGELLYKRQCNILLLRITATPECCITGERGGKERKERKENSGFSTWSPSGQPAIPRQAA